MIERKENGYVSVKEYYEFIKKESKEKDSAIKKLQEEMKVLFGYADVVRDNVQEKVFGNIGSISEMLYGKVTEEEFIKMLKIVFGELLFEMKDKKEVMYNLFGDVYGVRYGYFIFEPNSWNEFYTQIKNCFNIFRSQEVPVEQKEPYYVIVFTLKNLVEKTLASKIEIEREQRFILSKYEEFINSYNKNKKIVIDENQEELIKNILNKDSRKFIKSENGIEENLGLGDGYLTFVGCYNEVIDETLAMKDAAKKDKKQNNISLKNKVKKYYNYLSKTNIKNMNGEKLPSYSDPDFQSVMKELFELFKDNEKYVSINAILSAYYIAYIKSEDYKEVYTDEQTNEMEPKVIK